MLYLSSIVPCRNNAQLRLFSDCGSRQQLCQDAERQCDVSCVVMNVANPSYYLRVVGGSKIYMKTVTDIQIGTKTTGRHGFAFFTDPSSRRPSSSLKIDYMDYSPGPFLVNYTGFYGRPM